MVANDFLRKNNSYLAAGNDCESAGIVIFGVPMDWTASFRAGSREGPADIRKFSYALEEYSVYQGRDLRDASFFDAGDVELPFGDVEGSLRRIGKVVGSIASAGKLPFMLGGEHLASLPAVKVLKDLYPDLAVVQFDAHADLRDEYLSSKLSHATVMRRVQEIIGRDNLYQFGIRSGDRDEFGRGIAPNMYLYEVYGPFRRVLPDLKGRPVYVTLDIDVIDPAYAPGTGTPEPGGCTPMEMWETLHLLSELNVVGFDLVEVCPACDHAGVTSILAAKLVREAVLSIQKRKI
ncbi:MAG TPA: agmatinase [Clostridia bacterium]|nr:agmatinase [Clostridia bacterium]